MINNFIQWGLDRDLYNNSTREKQILKYLEEKGELAKAVGKNDKKLVMDAIGDMIVCLSHVAYYERVFDDQSMEVFKYNIHSHTDYKNTVVDCVIKIDDATEILAKGLATTEITDPLKCIAKNFDTTLFECMEHAWSEIKDRKGKFINGLFVKEK